MQMGKSANKLHSPPLCDFVQECRPVLGHFYRLIDKYHRCYPMPGHPALACHPVFHDPPADFTGRFKIQFEDKTGTVIEPDDGKLPEIEIAGDSIVTASPDDIE